MKRLHEYLARSGMTKFDQLPGNDVSLVASYVRRSHGLALAVSPAAGGSSRVFDDPAFALVPLRDYDLNFTVDIA